MKRLVLLAACVVAACGDDASTTTSSSTASGGGGDATGSSAVSSAASTGPGPARTDSCVMVSGFDNCATFFPEEHCTWFVQKTAPGCSSIANAADVGCYSQFSRCDENAPCFDGKCPSTQCGEGQTCTYFDDVGDCTGSVTEGTFTCTDGCKRGAFALCLPAMPP